MLPTPVLLVAFAVAFSGAPAAQHHPAPPPSARPAPPPQPQAPPPPTTMPYPPLMPPPAGGLTPTVPFTTPPAALPSRPDLYRVRPGDRVYSRTHGQPSIGYGGFYGYGYDVPPTPAAPSAPAAEETGMLRLTGTPESAQIFIDGYYIGALADVESQRVLTLPVGPHRIEIRAADYVPTTFDVRIGPNDTITYRAALEHVRPQPPARAAAPPANPTRMYLIPNCYLGNVPPKRDRLPRGCDIKRVQVIS